MNTTADIIEADTHGVVIACPQCGKRNRMSYERLGQTFRCGQCHHELSAPAAPVEIKAEAAFDALTAHSAVPVLVDFWAPWCGPCKIVAPAVEKLSQELAGQLKAVKVNTDLAPELQERFGVRGIPTLVLMDGGKERDRVVGAMGVEALRQWVGQRLPARSK